MSRPESPKASDIKFGGGCLGALDGLEVPVLQLLEALNDPSVANDIIESRGTSREAFTRSLDIFIATLRETRGNWW